MQKQLKDICARGHAVKTWMCHIKISLMIFRRTDFSRGYRELDDFIKLTEAVKEYYLNSQHDNHQYQELFLDGIDEFHETAVKLRKITGIIKTQVWYQDIGADTSGIVPHAFALDSRYGTLIKMYQLKHPKLNVKLDPNYAYSWKKSSSLFEMWCYLKICRNFLQRYELSTSFYHINFDNNMLFPFLNNGTTMSFENENIRINVIFDQFVPRKKNATNKFNNPFYIVSKNNRPDITVDIYSKTSERYIGSIILECKYRKLGSYWFDTQDNGFKASASSKPQIYSYYNDARSQFYYPGVPNTRPVQRVIVLTPDVNGNNRYACGQGIINKALKPSTNDIYLNEVMDLLCENIDSCYADKQAYLKEIQLF